MDGPSFFYGEKTVMLPRLQCLEAVSICPQEVFVSDDAETGILHDIFDGWGVGAEAVDGRFTDFLELLAKIIFRYAAVPVPERVQAFFEASVLFLFWRQYAVDGGGKAFFADIERADEVCCMRESIERFRKVRIAAGVKAQCAGLIGM